MKRIEDIMTKNIITIDVNAKVTDAAKILKKHNIGSLIVTKNKDTIGIVTERDIAYKYAAKIKTLADLDTKVDNIMSSPLITLSLDDNTNIMEAIMLMSSRKIKRICITKKGKLIGILAELDLFRELSESYVKSLEKMIQRI